jgi:diphosphate-dependent phosphofructokinase
MGIKGLLKKKYVEITDELVECYRNQGGFEMIASSREKIETETQFLCCKDTVESLNLNGLVVIGGVILKLTKG